VLGGGARAHEAQRVDVGPLARFERHQHDEEQITLVIEGQLVFELDDGGVVLEPGEVIAIPPGVRHAVRGGERGARAVDAWSRTP
jgi:quercetin dioxygenase-like cupin family protein